MLEARSVALVGASARPGSLGARMIAEVARSPSRPRTYLVNPRYPDIGGTPCLPSLAELPEPVDLVLLAVPDAALEAQMEAAARTRARSAVIFGSAFDLPGTSGLRSRLAAIAGQAGMAVCGAGCMGFVNVARGLRAVGYLEPDLHPGPVALVTHSGSVFSALLRARRGFGFSLAVSSGQELVTTAAAYARYALSLPETRVLALVLEAIRDAADLRAVLAEALAADVPAVLLSVGASAAGKALVSAHSGALAAADGAWEALAGAYGLHRVRDLAELADTLELFSVGRGGAGRRGSGRGGAGRRCPPGTAGIATVHDSGLERAHVADLAAELGVPFAPLGAATRDRLAAALDPGLAPDNPLDVWGTGRDTEPLFAECLSALADDPAVAAVALAVDLVPEFDGDESYPRAVLTTAARTPKPVAVLAGLPAAVDPAAAAALRAAGVPVLEGTRSGLLALRHLLDHAEPKDPPPDPDPPGDTGRRWRETLARHPGGLSGAVLFDLLRDYGLPVVRARQAATRAAALAAAAAIGYPVVLKTDEPGIAHKSDVGGVRLGLADPAAVGAAYDDLAARLSPRVLVCETAAPGTELALGLVRDAALGPLLVISAGGVLIEIFAERAVLLAPVTRSAAAAALGRLRLAAVLAGTRGQPPADLGAIADAITGLSRLACDLGDALDALDINPLICGQSGAVAADVLLIPSPVPPPGFHDAEQFRALPAANCSRSWLCHQDSRTGRADLRRLLFDRAEVTGEFIDTRGAPVAGRPRVPLRSLRITRVAGKADLYGTGGVYETWVAREQRRAGAGRGARRPGRPAGRLQLLRVGEQRGHLGPPGRHRDGRSGHRLRGGRFVRQHRRAVRSRSSGQVRDRPGQLRQPDHHDRHRAVLPDQDRERRRPDRRRAVGQVRQRDGGCTRHHPGPGQLVAGRARPGVRRRLQHRRDHRRHQPRGLPARREQRPARRGEGDHPAGGHAQGHRQHRPEPAVLVHHTGRVPYRRDQHPGRPDWRRDRRLGHRGRGRRVRGQP
jgi:acyl-CoA synthetase (NDP forming)